ncbi:type 1 pili tip component [Ectothiorhodospiraceae bacterium WFHF3C12]|nr:type 1 pili tip component [Ectothiorhodospiraceae bacterium WFHF3C12]
MKMKDLLETWESSAGERRTPQAYAVQLPIHDAAKLAALSEMYPGRSEQDIITDLLSTALDEIEAAFPYVQGHRVVAEDEHGDPIYEDAGLTPRFQSLTRKHLQRLEEQLGEE